MKYILNLLKRHVVTPEPTRVGLLRKAERTSIFGASNSESGSGSGSTPLGRKGS